MKLGPHLHRIGNDIVAAYLVETPDGITVIDAGLPGHWHDLQDELADDGPVDRRRARPDPHPRRQRPHRIRRATAPRARRAGLRARGRCRAREGGGRQAEGPKTIGPKRLGAMLGFFAYALRKGGMRTPYLTEVVEVADGDVLAAARAPR